MTNTENPPAFPRTGEGFGNPLYDTPGMSLRDWFAGQALAGMVAGSVGLEITTEQFGEQTYRLADAMLAARTSKENPA